MKTHLGIRWQLFGAVTPVVVVPIILIVLFMTIVMFSYLEERNKDFYASVMQILSGNIDYIYEQYGRTFTNAVKIPNVERGLNSPPYKSQFEEQDISQMIVGKHVIINNERVTAEGLRKTFEEKVDGELLLYELDRKSLISGTDYKVHRLSGSTMLIDLDGLFKTQMYRMLKSDSNIRLIAGSLGGDILKTSDGLPRTTMIYPYYRERKESNKSDDTFTKFLLVELQPSLIKKLYCDIEHIKFGTLYILDRFDNLVSCNHPDYNDDYYDYDKQKGQYILGDNPAKDSDESMCFSDYKLLNTDINILQKNEVKVITDKLNSRDFYSADYDKIFNKKIILYKGISYLMTVDFCPKSEFKLVYFHPLAKVREPIYFIIRITICCTILITAMLIGLTLVYSRRFTIPIEQLASSAAAIAGGEYGNMLDISKFSGEFLDLGASFNVMSQQIMEYNLHMEDIVARKTAEAERLLLNILPEDIARELKEHPDHIISKKYPNATVLFTDIVGFTKMSSSMTAEDTVIMLNHITSLFDERAQRENIEKIKTIGDAYMAAVGLTENVDNDGAVKMCRFALGLLKDVAEFNKTSPFQIEIRIGINSGELVAGVIGKTKFIYDVWGDTVNVASRMESNGEPMRVQVSETTYQQTKGNFDYKKTVKINVKGKGLMDGYLL